VLILISKMSRMRIKYILLAGITMFLSGCMGDLLDKGPEAELSPDNFYNNYDEADMALMGVYNSFEDAWWHSYEFMSDNGYCHHSWQGSLDFGSWTHNSSSGRARDKWAIAYRTIGRVNMFIENMEECPVDADTKNVMLAEARFIRGYFYADLIHFFGDVPLILKTLSLDEAKVERTAKAEVIKAIEDDFDFAIKYLKDKPSDVGRASLGAAWAFKARMYLYQQRWAEAAAAAQKVIDLDVYDLYDDYEEIFEEQNENNIEIIFDLQYIKNLRPQPWPSTCLNFTEWPTAGVTLNILDQYYMKGTGKPITDGTSGYSAERPLDNRDPRMAATFVLPGSPFVGGMTYIPANLETEVQTAARPRKYADIDNTDRGNCGLNIILMRYADILLIRAEALIESGETGQEVYDLINAVRQRESVNMPKIENVEGTNLSTEQLRKILRHERRVEFAFEFTRYSDMRRWEDKDAVQDVWTYNKAKLKDPNVPSEWVFERIKIATRTFDDKKGWLWPIPQDERQNNPNLTQNTGF